MMINDKTTKSIRQVFVRVVGKFKAKKLKALLLAFLISLTLLPAVQAQASTDQMNQTMVRMINQIDALFPLIEQASKEQDKTARVQFHFNSWVDANGVKHDGLKDNLLEIRTALVNQINQSNLTPKRIAPMNGDYVVR